MFSYQIRETAFGSSIVKIEDGLELWIPEDSGNRHYQEYLAWIAEGNTPEVIND